MNYDKVNKIERDKRNIRVDVTEDELKLLNGDFEWKNTKMNITFIETVNADGHAEEIIKHIRETTITKVLINKKQNSETIFLSC